MLNVRDLGAVGDGKTKDTAALQKALDQGGTVVVPPGTYLSGTLYLHDDTELRLETGATLLAMHIFIGVGMTIRLIPVIGLPLPLLSYGGSFTVAVCTLLGALYGCDRNADARENADDDGAARPQTIQCGFLFRLRIFK